MKIIVTGKTSSGKTACLQQLKNYPIFYMDDIVKSWYKTNNDLKQLLIKEWNNDVLTNNKIDTTKLGIIVFNNKEALKKLNQIVFPFVKDFILKQDDKDIILFEMAAYIGNEELYRDLVDKVVLIEREQRDLSNKFTYGKNIDPLKEIDLHQYDLVIKNNKSLDECVNQLKIFLNQI